MIKIQSNFDYSNLDKTTQTKFLSQTHEQFSKSQIFTTFGSSYRSFTIITFSHMHDRHKILINCLITRTPTHCNQ